MPLPLAASARFEIVRSLGKGGMGVVYEAIDRERDVRVALKTLSNFSPEGLARFKREFRAVEGLSHPNLVSLGELVCEGEQWFFTMELLDGVDFIRWVRPWHRALETAPDGTSLESLAPTSGARLAATLDAPERAQVEPEGAASSAATSGRQTQETQETQETQLETINCDEERLRAAMADLARGLLALHAADRVHRDIKPSNVRVTNEGRVVLLDFGIVTELEMEPERSSVRQGFVGTPAYMAPEQTMEGAVTPAADWYGAGAMLYEALTGRLPFEGSNAHMVAQKQRGAPIPPSALVHGVPVDLETLCLDLLALEPSGRPAGHEVLERLAQRSARTSGTPAPASVRERPSLLVGRELELGALHDSFARTAGSAVALLVYGESGIGKTWLVRAFLERVAAEGGLLVLQGQCREREAVPYKALDEVIDQLAARLGRMSEAALDEVAPAHVGALLHVFPVLSQVRAFVRHAETESLAQTLDPRELRRRAFLALRELFGHLGEQARTIIVVDDLQWADQDSFALLATLLRPPSPPSLLFIATVRTSADAPNEVPRRISASIPGDVRHLHVGPLREPAARELAAKRIFAVGPADPTLAATIAADANGHPLFIDELARRAEKGLDISALKLDDALWSRIEGLAPTLRTVAQLVALSPAPLLQETVARAADLHLRDFAAIASHLRASNIVRTGGARTSDRIEPYHDRVRETAVARLSSREKRELHERLAIALEAEQAADAETLTFHWREAGDAASARKYAKIAADQAWNALAFDRAAEWYAVAIELTPEGERDRALRLRLGEALGNAGRGALAAAELARAAEGAGAEEALELQQRAVEQLLRSGHVSEGLEVAARVLETVGMTLPRSPIHAIALLVFWRIVLRIRGFGYVKRDPSRIPPLELMRVDTCGSLGITFGLSDTLSAWFFSTRGLVLALQAGDPRRIVYPMTAAAGESASGGGRTRARTDALLARAGAIAEESGDRKTAAWVLGVKGYAHYAAGEFPVALDLFVRAEDELQSCGAKGYEISSTQFFMTNTLAILGRLKECSARVPALLQDARERDDLFAAVNFRTGYSNLVWLVADDPESSRRHLADARAVWSKHGFHVEHFYALLAGINVALYARDPVEATELLAQNLPRYARSFLARIETIRVRTWQLRARCALARAAAGIGERKASLRDARRMGRKIAREQTGWAAPSAALIEATVLKLDGRRDAAVDLLEKARHGFTTQGLELDAAVASYCKGTLLARAEGRVLVEEARAWMRAQTVKRPDAFVAMLAPGFADESPRPRPGA